MDLKNYIFNNILNGAHGSLVVKARKVRPVHVPDNLTAIYELFV
jgi:hypothetical protein